MTVLLAATMAVLDGSIVNVALPSLAFDMGATPAQAIWVVTAYQVAVVVSLLPLAALGEVIGFCRVYLGGMLVFAAASLLCATANSLEGLVVARALQGVGGAALMSINVAIVRQIMPRSRLGRGISWVATVVAVSAAAGPSLAAGVLSVGSWHWLFLINLPISALAIGLGYASLPRAVPNKTRFDGVSALLNVLTFGSFILALGSLGVEDQGPRVVVGLAVAVTAGVLLTRRQLSKAAPMLPLDLLRRPVVAASILSSASAFCAQFVAFVSLPFFLQTVLGYSEVDTGLLLTSWPLASAIAAPLAGRLADRQSPTLLTTAGMAIFTVGLAAIGLVPVTGGPGPMIAALVVSGVGFGVFQAPNNQLILTGAPLERSGAASGLLSTARLLGQSVGAALAALLLGTSGQVDVYVLTLTAAGFGALSLLVCVLRDSALRWGLIA